MAESFIDERIRAMAIYLGSKTPENLKVDNQLVNIVKDFQNGNYIQSYNSSLDLICKTPYEIEIAEILVKSAIILNKDCPKVGAVDSTIGKIIEDLYNIHSKNINYETSLYTLGKIAKSICSALWCNELISILNSEQSFQFEKYNFDLHKTLLAVQVSPKLCEFLTYENKAQFEFIYQKNSNENQHIFIEKSLPDLESSGIFQQLRSAKYLIKEQKYAEAFEYIKTINNHPKNKDLLNLKFIKLLIIKLEIDCYLKLDRPIDILEIITHSVIETDKFYYSLFNKEVVTQILSSENELIQGNICTPILARLYKDKINDIWIAYDNFMYVNKYAFPKDVFLETQFKAEFQKYFLRYVCIQDVYDSSPSFKNPEDLDNQRIAICNFLCTVDPKCKEEYINEITETETNALIKKGIREIDESKIFVDIAGIWREMETEVKERFARGRELLKLSKDEIDYLLEMSSSVLVLFMKNEEEGSLIKFDKTAKRNEGIANQPHFINFKENFLLIRDRFISSNEFGLDSYISMRIRHGTLLGQIRSIYEKFHLITKKNAHTKQYIDNSYWLDKLSIEKKNKAGISEKLNTFSEEIDLMSEEIKNSLLQIKTEEKSSNGLFDYKYDDDELIKLYEGIFYNIENHVSFFESTVDTLWQRTENNLEIIREKFKNEYCHKALSNLEELFTSVEKYHKRSSTNIDTREFRRDITACKTDTTNSFEKISLWFRRSYSKSINEFDLKLVLRICFSIVNKMHPQTPIQFAAIENTSTSILNGQYFAFLIDMMRNILDNIIIRSELIEPELQVKLNIFEDKGILYINNENNVSKTVNLESANQRIATTQYRLDNNEGDPLVKQEGGTGYIKIKNIIKINLKRKNFTLKVEPIKDDERIFRSTISFELRNLIKT
ncbi:MAG: hypothetical protein Q8L81_05795 [Bacteroidota bacterium]|nr:hypothetical protein [Bacteroidota bacterium]